MTVGFLLLDTLCPKESSFPTFFESDDLQALISLICFDHSTFQEFHSLFAPVFNGFTPFSWGEYGIHSDGIPSKKSGGFPQAAKRFDGLAILMA